jgi:mRNA interferase MazF
VRRGDIVTVALQGAYGKPRPALVIQSDVFAEHPSITILPITSVVREDLVCRITVEPTALNGLHVRSQIMADKAHSVPRENIGEVIGSVGWEAMLAVNRALVMFLELG